MMNGRQIEIFHALMHMGTVTKAAERLNISQPAVTNSIKQIEKQLGFDLFHRTGGRLHPTNEARILFGEAERIQNSLSLFERLAERLRENLTSHLYIAALPAFSNALVSEATARFLQKHTNCLIDISTQHHKQIFDDLSSEDGRHNLGFTFGTGDRPGLGSTLVGQAGIVALIPSNWPLASRTEISLTDLSGMPLVGTFPGEPLGDAVEKMMFDAGLISNFKVRIHNHFMAASLAGKGVGATLIDTVTAAFTQSQQGPSGFCAIAVKDAPQLPVTAIYSYARPLNKHAKNYIKTFRQTYRSLFENSKKPQA